MIKDEQTRTRALPPAAPAKRLSEMPGFVPWQPGDPFPSQLRQEMNVHPFVRHLHRIAQEAREGEARP